MAQATTLKVYQLDAIIAGSEDALTDTSTLADLKEYLLDGKGFDCPQCGLVGTIEDGVTVCPTCDGDGKTTVAYMTRAVTVEYVLVE